MWDTGVRSSKETSAEIRWNWHAGRESQAITGIAGRTSPVVVHSLGLLDYSTQVLDDAGLRQLDLRSVR